MRKNQKDQFIKLLNIKSAKRSESFVAVINCVLFTLIFHHRGRRETQRKPEVFCSAKLCVLCGKICGGRHPFNPAQNYLQNESFYEI